MMPLSCDEGLERDWWKLSPVCILTITVPSQGLSNLLFGPDPPPWPSLSIFSIFSSLLILFDL